MNFRISVAPGGLAIVAVHTPELACEREYSANCMSANGAQCISNKKSTKRSLKADHFTTPLAFNATISDSSNPNSRRTRSLSSPNAGAPLVGSTGVLENRIG